MVQILDTTLREGEQSPGVYFDTHIKLAIAKQLDNIGVDYIEAGHPAVTEEIHQIVKKLANLSFRAIVGAHARSLKKDVDLALECGVKFLGIFYCVSDQRLTHIFNKNLDEAIDQITSIIRYAKEQRPDLIIRYTPEDTVRSPWNNVEKAAIAAVEAGADIISIADTTGYLIPGTENNMYDFVTKLKNLFRKKNLAPKIAVHCHNDRGLALANALDGFRAGADIIDTTILGLGERAGLVDMATLMAVLKNDFHVKNQWKLKKIPDLYRLVSEYSGLPIPVNFPITGENAFTHCAGVHTQAAAIDPVHYESLNPEVVGRERKIALGHMSGISSIKYALSKLGESDLDETVLKMVLDKVKTVGKKSRIIDQNELRHIVDWCKEHKAE